MTTNADGTVAFALTLSRGLEVGQAITATATNPGGNISEFSAPRTVAAG